MTQVWVLTDERYLEQRMPRLLVDELRGRGLATRTLVAERLVQSLGAEGDRLDPWRDLRAGDVVLARTRNRAGLAMLRSAARPGVTVLTPPDPIATVRDKPRTAQALAAAGIATPVTWLVDTPALLRQLPVDRFPLLLKPHAGDNARGIVLVRGAADLDDLEWRDSMVLAQEYVESGAVDLKVYAAGDRVWAVRRPSPLVLPGRTVPTGIEPVPVTPQLRRIADACARAFDLQLFGIDVLETSRGPLVVDVNEFPNFTGVDDAVTAVADLVVGASRLVAA